MYNYTIRDGSMEMKTREEELPKKLQRADIRMTPDDRPLPASGRPAPTGRPAHLHPSQISGRPTTPDDRRPDDRRPDDRQLPDVRCHLNRAKVRGSPVTTGRPEAHEPPDDRSPVDVRYLSAYRDWARGPCIPLPLTPSWT